VLKLAPSDISSLQFAHEVSEEATSHLILSVLQLYDSLGVFSEFSCLFSDLLLQLDLVEFLAHQAGLILILNGLT
jgi:hypothetical protein